MQRRTSRIAGTGGRAAEKRTALGAREKRRLLQLGLCVGLFLAVFFGKGAVPDTGTGQELLRLLQTDTDFQSAFSALGKSLSDGEPVWEVMGRLAGEMFGLGGERTASDPPARTDGPAFQAAMSALARRPTEEAMLQALGASPKQPEADGGGEAEDAAPSEPEIPEYTGPDLPDGSTMAYVDLGLDGTVTPVLGRVTSAYGYRDHPVNGEYLFHAGVDLAAEEGAPVAAFADGTVEYIGESDVYGLYVQIDHANGVQSFYCHCSALYVGKGDAVSKGQTIAAVGQTGNATGSHLHLELKKDGVRLNPLYYIDCQEQDV